MSEPMDIAEAEERKRKAEHIRRFLEEMQRARARTGNALGGTGEGTKDAGGVEAGRTGEPNTDGNGEDGAEDAWPRLPADAIAAMDPRTFARDFPSDSARLAGPEPPSPPFADSLQAVRIPSGGRFQPDGNIGLTPSGEAMVRALTAREEVLVADPMALFTGTAVRDVLARCVQGLRDPMQLPYPDVRALLLGIRAATYGDVWEMESTCPACSAPERVKISISALFAAIRPIREEDTVAELPGGTVVRMRPVAAWAAHQGAMHAAEQMRVYRTILESDADDETKRRKLSDVLASLHESVIRTVARGSVLSVRLPDGREIDDPDAIERYVGDLPAGAWRTLRARHDELARAGLPDRLPVRCDKCGHEYEIEPPYDPAVFFSVS